MPSDAAKKRAEQKKAALAKKRQGAAPPSDNPDADNADANDEQPGDQADDAAADSAPAASGPASNISVNKSAGAPAASVLRDASVVFPPELTPAQRACLHAIAERVGIPHESETVGPRGDRQLRLGPATAEAVVLRNPSGSSVTDEKLASWLQQHLQITVAAAELPGGQGDGGGAAQAKRKQGASAAAPGGKQGWKPAACKPISPDAFVAKTLPLIEMERRAEEEAGDASLAAMRPETAVAKGSLLRGLVCTDAAGGLYGKMVVTLSSVHGGDATLPAHKFSPHDVVAIRPNKGDSAAPPIARGVIYRVADAAIKVALDEPPEEALEGTLRLEKLANEVTFQRYKSALMAVSKAAARGSGGGGHLVEVLFGVRPPRFSPEEIGNFTPVNPGLDSSQREAVSFALRALDCALVHGPPGTGKTTAVVEIILQSAARGMRVLACAASNIATDNLVERIRLGNNKLKVVRLGHPARVLPAVLDVTLEALVLGSDNSSLANDCRKERKTLSARLLKLTSRDRAERRDIRKELNRLEKEERQRQQAAVAEVIKNSQVVAATLTGAMGRNLDKEEFDLVVVDEAAQALEVAAWGALLKGKRALLAGDHLQLPPTVVSEEAEKLGLGTTLFERAHGMYGEEVARMLTTQYRMNSVICDWASDELYGGLLKAAETVAGHTLGTLGPAAAAPKAAAAAPATGGKKGAAAAAAAAAGAASKADLGALKEIPVLLLIDTAGCDFEEEADDESDSKRNEGEAKAALAHAARLVEAGLPAESVGVITPYCAQVALLREMRSTFAKGALEKVRSNSKREVGFLADARRMNVAVTRARRHCALVCDSETVSVGDAFLKRLVEYFEANGDVASAQELVPC